MLNILKLGKIHPVCAEIRKDGRTMAHVMDLPGCISKGDSLDQALAKLPGEIEDYRRWISSHFPQKSTGSNFWELIEVQEGVAPFESGDAAALFQLDLYPPDDQEMEEYFLRMEASRKDLLNLISSMGEEELKKERVPGKRTIEKILWHIAHAEEWYISRLGIIPDFDDLENFQGTVFELLKAVRKLAYKRLRSLSPLERTTVFRIPEFTDNPDEPWTLRKTLRRFLEHEREHLRNIRELLKGSQA
ncbi:MAG: DinB family protein [Caldiserica bacterium]|jgi:uncharacterized damage-inducible protein DinB|nr:DinB family protein [Caldisericota bacterium]MDH7562212.1 DinB family protein [Caldisericota bacterium]